MSDFFLVSKNLTRKKLRLFLTLFAIFIAFLIFGVLSSFKIAFDAGIDLAADDRLVTVNKINFTQSMPISYISKIRSVEGVQGATYADWFGGYYQDPQKQLIVFGIDVESYMPIYPELILPDEQLRAFLANQQGAIVGKRMADAQGWSLGQRVPISSNIYSKAEDGSQTWDMDIEGIFTANDPALDTNYMMFHHKYLDEARSFGRDTIGWIILTTGDPATNDRVARAIDEQFANSPFETQTDTEKAFNKAFVAQIGNIALIITSVVGAAFVTILFIVGNTMVLAIRERTKEIAVLKTIGFSARRIFGHVLGESFLLAFIGGTLGLAMAAFLIWLVGQTPVGGFLPGLTIKAGTIVQAVLMMSLLGFVTGIIPATNAMRLNIITALSRR